MYLWQECRLKKRKICEIDPIPAGHQHILSFEISVKNLFVQPISVSFVSPHTALGANYLSFVAISQRGKELVCDPLLFH
jgi:hypothetical protein